MSTQRCNILLMLCLLVLHSTTMMKLQLIFQVEVERMQPQKRVAKSLLSMLLRSSASNFEMLMEDLKMGPQIGKGAFGTVYHAKLNGSDVAVKVFPKEEYSYDLILSFKKEVSLLA